MKKHPYRLTDTGIRIPKHKTKWVASRSDEPFDCPAALPVAGKKATDTLNLFVKNYSALVLFGQDTIADEDIASVEWKEANYDEN